MESLPNPKSRRRIDTLLSAHCDGRLDAGGKKELTAILEGDQEARRYYLHYLDLHFELDRRSEVTNIVALPQPPQRKNVRGWLALAAAIAVAAIPVTYLLQKQPVAPIAGDPEAPIITAVQDGPVAFISRVEGVEWDYKSPAESGLELQSSDSIEMTAGKIRLDFFEGSSATIVAPARFTIFSSTEMALFSGQIAVRSDGPTPGFAVRTPSGVFVDVGTEFALNVMGAAETQMRVIEGEVIATLLSADAVALDERSAYAGEYLTVDPYDGITEADLVPEDFSEMLDPSTLPLEIPEQYVAAVRASKPVAYWRFESGGTKFVDEIGDHTAVALGQPRLEGRKSGNKTIVLEGDESKRGLFVEAPLTQFSDGEYSVEMWVNAQSQQFGGLVSLIEIDFDTLKQARVTQPKHRMMALEFTSGERSRRTRAPQGWISFSHKHLNRIGGPGNNSGRGQQRDKGHVKWQEKGQIKRSEKGHHRRPDKGRESSPDGHSHDYRHDHSKDWKDSTAEWAKKTEGGHHNGWGGGRKPGSNWSHGHHGGGFPGSFAGGSWDFESRVYSQERYVPGTWHHVVAVREGERILLYLDGRLEATTEAEATSEKMDLRVIIGRYSLASGWLGRPFYGRLDELAIYPRALSAEEVRDHAELAQ